MPSIEDQIKERFERINSIPDKFISDVEKSQRQIFEKIQSKLEQLERLPDGRISLTTKNLALIEELGEDLKSVISQGSSRYTKAVEGFIGEFGTQKDIVKNFFEGEFEFENKPIYDKLYENATENSYDLVANAAVDQHISEFKDMLQTAVGSSENYVDTVKNIRTLIEGNENIDGGLARYAKQNAKDIFSVTDRQYSQQIANSLDIKFYQYSGGLIKTSRPFCVERHGKIFSAKEIEAWGAGKKTLMLNWPKSGEWAGMAKGTSKETIFSLLGGYNCDHVLLPVGENKVPKDVWLRNIEQGFIEVEDIPEKIREKFGIE